MKIMTNFINNYNTEYLLIKYSNNHYAYGTTKDLNSFLGVPVQQTGTKEEILRRCESLIKLNKKHINNFESEKSKDNHNGWNILINDASSKIEMLQHFIYILKMEG